LVNDLTRLAIITRVTTSSRQAKMSFLSISGAL